jgi:hypothetical protein
MGRFEEKFFVIFWIRRKTGRFEAKNLVISVFRLEAKQKNLKRKT